MKEIQTSRKYRCERQAKQIYSLSSNYGPRGVNPPKESLSGRQRPQAISLGDGIASLGSKAWNAIEARCTRLGPEITNVLHGLGCPPLPAALGSSCKDCHPLWLLSFLCCHWHFVSTALLCNHSVQASGEGIKQNLPLFSSFHLLGSSHLAPFYGPLANNLLTAP